MIVNPQTDERLMRNDSSHLIEVATENGWCNIYISDPQLGMVHVSKYWSNAYWSAYAKGNHNIEFTAKGASLLDALANLKITYRMFTVGLEQAT